MSSVAQDLEKHLAKQVEDVVARFMPIAMFEISHAEAAVMLARIGTGVIGMATTSLAASAKPGAERFVIDAVLSVVRGMLDRMPDQALKMAKTASEAAAK